MVALGANAQIFLTPAVDSDAGGLDKNTLGAIDGRLRTIISRAGCESGYGGRFVMAVKVSLLDRNFTNSAPVMIAQTIQVTLAIGDVQTQSCFGSTTFEANGIGPTEAAALLSAVKSINPNSPEFKKLVADSKAKIIDYYTKNGPSIVGSAKSLMTNHQYDEAIEKLADIPQECPNYPEAANMMTTIYQSNINHDAAQILAEAQAVWSADPNPGPGAEQAMAILSGIDTSAKCYPQAQALMKKIEARVKTVTDANAAHERQMEKARLNTAAALEKARIRACRDIAVARAKSRPKVVYHFSRWGWW